MPLRVEDKKWITENIKSELDVLKPRGLRKFLFGLREWGVVGTIVTVFLSLIAICITLAMFAASNLTKNAEFRTHTEDRLTNIEAGFNSLKASIANLQITQATSFSGNVNPKAASSALISAIAEKIPISKETINHAGSQLVDASDRLPEAWDVALQFVTYKTKITDNELPRLISSQHRFLVRYSPTQTNLIKAGDVQWVGFSQPPDTPQFRGLTSPDLNEDKNTGPSFLIDSNTSIILDNLYIKRVIFKNSHIIYRGGPVHLEMVSFSNCTFELPHVPNAQQFALSILSPNPFIDLVPKA